MYLQLTTFLTLSSPAILQSCGSENWGVRAGGIEMGNIVSALGVIALLAVGAGAATLSQPSSADCKMVVLKQGGELIELVVCDDGSSFELAHGKPLADATAP